MHELSELEALLAYCFNEFLKMCEYLQGEMEVGKKEFINFVIQVFKEKVDEATIEELASQTTFIFPEKKVQKIV